MHHHEHNSNNGNSHIKTRFKKIKHLNSIANRESICYHESGHTAMSILLHGWYEYQIQRRFWWLAVSTSENIHHADLQATEALWILLAGFAAQRLQKIDYHDENHGEKMFQYSVENSLTPGLLQPDTLIWLYILRKEFKKRTWRKMSPEQQRWEIHRMVDKITDFFKSQPKILALIEILSKQNETKPILNRNDINECLIKSWITSNEMVDFANQFRNIGLLDFSNSSSPQSSAE